MKKSLLGRYEVGLRRPVRQASSRSFLSPIVLFLVAVVLVAASSSSCVSTPVSLSIANAQDVVDLAAAVLCEGASVEAKWAGRIVTPGTIFVGHDASLVITGKEEAGIDCQGNCQIFFVSEGASLTLNNFSLFNGYSATYGGCIRAVGSSVMCEGCKVRNCSAQHGGGGVHLSSGTLVMTGDSAISNCTTARSGGGIRCETCDVSLNGAAQVTSNKADSEGGGLYFYGGSLMMGEKSIISGNSASEGGGISAWGVEIDVAGDSTVEGNTASDYGGGLHIREHTKLTMHERSSVSGNQATDGGGVYAASSVVALSESASISGNHAIEGLVADVSYDGSSDVIIETGPPTPSPETPAPSVTPGPTPMPSLTETVAPVITPTPTTSAPSVTMVSMRAELVGEDASAFTQLKRDALSQSIEEVCGSPPVGGFARRKSRRIQSLSTPPSATLFFNLQETSVSELIQASKDGLLLLTYRNNLRESGVPNEEDNLSSIAVDRADRDSPSVDPEAAVPTPSSASGGGGLLIGVVVAIPVVVGGVIAMAILRRRRRRKSSGEGQSLDKSATIPQDADPEAPKCLAPAFGHPRIDEVGMDGIAIDLSAGTTSFGTSTAYSSAESACSVPERLDDVESALEGMLKNNQGKIVGLDPALESLRNTVRTIAGYKITLSKLQKAVTWTSKLTSLFQCVVRHIEENSCSPETLTALTEELLSVENKIQQFQEVIQSYARMGVPARFLHCSLSAARREEAKTLMADTVLRLEQGELGGSDVTALRNSFPLEGKQSSFSGLDGQLSTRFLAKALRRRAKEALQPTAAIDRNDIVMGGPIGQGAFSTAYIAGYNGHNVAAKVFRCGASDLTSAKFKKQFTNELEIMRSIQHDNILAVFGSVSTDDGCFALILELAAGGDLRRFLDGSRSPGEENGIGSELKSRFMVQIACGVACLHSHNVEHRDLKSPNILLTSALQVKVSDFGMSRITSVLSTQTETWGGSTAWIAPEVLERSMRSPASDVYSLGVILWEVLTAKLPWGDEGFSGASIYGAVVHRKEKLIIPNGTSIGLRMLLDSCWKLNPGDRPSAEEVATALERGQWESENIFYS